MKSYKYVARYLVGILLAISVLVPCRMVTATEKKEPDDIVTVLSDNKQVSKLVELLKAAGLIDALEGEGPFTIFAPSNEAFRGLSQDLVADLLRPENKEKLEDILTYHVYVGKLSSEDVAKLANQEITMLNNKKAKITQGDGNLYINKAKILIKDIQASNGVIHIIDAVLIPE